MRPRAGRAVFARVDSICRLAESHGWPGREAFAIAMQLVAQDVTVAEAGAMFADAGSNGSCEAVAALCLEVSRHPRLLPVLIGVLKLAPGANAQLVRDQRRIAA